jgi:DNA-3-methyladenine glycosylase I
MNTSTFRLRTSGAASGGAPGRRALSWWMLEDGLRIGADGVARCWWSGGDDANVRYHDEEWGFPSLGDRRLFEQLSLESFQSGLSWLTILRKRAAFRRAFDEFEPARVADYGDADVRRLLADAGIVRHRGKIEAPIHNPRRALEIAEESGSLAGYLWSFEPPPEERPPRLSHEALSGLSETPSSRALSKDLRARGWRFLGPTTAYAFIQAAGLVNDHLDGCAVRRRAEAARGAVRTDHDRRSGKGGGGRASRKERTRSST